MPSALQARTACQAESWHPTPRYRSIPPALAPHMPAIGLTMTTLRPTRAQGSVPAGAHVPRRAVWHHLRS